MPLRTIHSSRFWLAAALLLALLSGYVAFTQEPRPDPFAPEPVLFSRDWWRYPLERNAFRRLPAVGGDVNDVFALPDGSHLWAVGEGGLILHSMDRGRHWHRQYPAAPLQAHLNSVFFVDAARGWAVGYDGTILATADGGEHWQAQASGSKAWLNSVQFLADGRRGWWWATV